MKQVLAVLTLALGAAQVPSLPAARLHHVHYNVADPSKAMADVVATLGGTREVVPGLGVGVRQGDHYWLFERIIENAEHRPTALKKDYAHAVEWLRTNGIRVDPTGLDHIERAPAGPFFDSYHHIAFAVPEFEPALTRLGTPLTRRQDSAMYDSGRGVLVEIVRETGGPDTFWCPMHPDVRSGVAGNCPQCLMALVPIPPPKVGEYRMDLAVQRTPRGASGALLTIRDPETDAVVTTFETIHEKTFHLFIVSRDLEYFAHVHPEPQKNGSFLLRHPLAPGEYMLIADFLPVGGTSQLLQRAVVVGPRSRFSTKAGLDDRDASAREAVIDGVRVALKAEDMVPGKDACLTFTLTHATTGAPITDLEPFLGAPAHMLMVRAGLEDALHAHPEELQTGGPTISFHPLIPAAGAYKLWIQFRRAGRDSTAAFVVSATR